ncbi:Os05g0299000 [Oryza sativa Japonica Group]|uniref:Os05g0299000 protein n=3 Tax=Oryza sativa TaxID=4530 RepID=Q0DJD3_ORYSJ|nr:hypothetical protein OsI_19352 [Oryza sativa Indica Group]KAB8098795.1 hypothetical protein EE612_028425 [Oryza sativa]KAF2930057.1 hypothetical protein DAI22_05g103700 [Oryza sativa Japonica Group]BAF17040.1 Os05g0299000 [Oryza sativa Japonica Group]BAG98503.1 unnamed protein product [Oryza sativa Japonica Group]|eukprot:NP_001055126.1 Os05g0299000 [Oryza sativa Japonica Group]
MDMAMAWTPAAPTPRSEAALAGELRGRRTTRHHAGRQALGQCSGLRLGGAFFRWYIELEVIVPAWRSGEGNIQSVVFAGFFSLFFFLLFFSRSFSSAPDCSR